MEANTLAPKPLFIRAEKDTKVLPPNTRERLIILWVKNMAAIQDLGAFEV
jgi:hypothetical protein